MALSSTEFSALGYHMGSLNFPRFSSVDDFVAKKGDTLIFGDSTFKPYQHTPTRGLKNTCDVNACGRNDICFA